MIIGVTILCGYSIFDDVLENERGVVHQTSLSFAFSAGLSLFFVSAMTATSYMAGRHFRLSSIPVMAVLITLVWLIALPALGGFTFSKRISSTTSDLTTRRHHWANSWNVVDDHQDELFGIGLGGFPRRYFDNHVGTGEVSKLSSLRRRTDFIPQAR